MTQKKIKYTVNDVMNAVLSLTSVVEKNNSDTVELFQSMKVDFDRLEDKVDKIDNRLTGVENRLTGVENRLDKVEFRLDGVEGRLTGVENRLSDVEVACVQNTRAIDELDKKFSIRFDRLESMCMGDTSALSRDLNKQNIVLKDHARRIQQLELARA